MGSVELTREDMARRGMLNGLVGSMMTGEHSIAMMGDCAPLAWLTTRLGAVARAVWAGDDPFDDLARLAATAMAWMEHIEQERAR